MKKTIVALLIVLIINTVSALAANLEVNIVESGKVTSYYDTYWVVSVEGSVSVHNPFNNSFDYVKIPYDIGTLTLIEDNATDYVHPGLIYIPFLDPDETITIDYEIRGISGYDPMYRNKSVFRSGLITETAHLFTFLISNIKKAEIENETINTEEVKSRENRRVVSVTLENPSDLHQNVTSITVIKTSDQDPNTPLETWYFPDSTDKIVIKPHSIWTEDILDTNSTEGEVYWLSTEAQTDTIPLLIGEHRVQRFSEEDLLSVENASYTEKEYLENVTEYLEHLMYLKKSVSSTHLNPGDEITVDIKVNNFAPISRNFTLTEQIPAGFLVTDSGGANASSGQKLRWEVLAKPDTMTLTKYGLMFNDNSSVGLDFFEPAVLRYENETLYSQRIPFIRRYVPEKRIFIQKKLRYSVADEIVVQLQIKNLGESSLENLYVKEFLGANDVFREISLAPEERGKWKIDFLSQGELWEVTYVTNENDAVNLLPEVYGVDKQLVLKTLVFENAIRNEWLSPALHAMEIFAPVFILGFIVFVFVFYRRVNTKRTRSITGIARQIKKTREATTPRNQMQIDLLKRESETQKDIPSVEGLNIDDYKNTHQTGDPKNIAKENIEKLKKVEEDTKYQKQ